jgi:hypothetical protein
MAQEAKFKHLDFIQGVVNRMGGNSFQVKAWTVTLVSALFALASSKDAEGKQELIFIAFLPVILFWILDGYFLWQERLFRAVYKEVAAKQEEAIDFVMNPMDYNKDRNTWIRSIFSKTLNIFYGALVGLMGLVLLLFMCK